MIEENDRFKFVDDLTALEIVDILAVGLTSYNFEQHVASDIPVHNQFVPPQNLKSEEWLKNINTWSINKKMQLNTNTNMIFNFTNKFQFSTRLHLNGQNLQILDSTKLLGTFISKD